jgi:5-bromo-4-chloroindolyl phosphate hydrolysis protein
MELTAAIAVAGLAVSVGTFFIGRTTAAKNSGKEYGVMLTEIGYIKSGVDDMKRKMESMEKSYHTLEGRVARLEERVNIYHKE